MVTLLNRNLEGMSKVTDAMRTSLGIIPPDSRVVSIVDSIVEGRYTIKRVRESGTLPLSSERPCLLAGKYLFVGGGEALGNALVMIDTDSMQIVKQITLVAGTNIGNTYNIVADDTYWYIGTNTGHIIKGLLKTGDVVLSKYDANFGQTYNMCVDESFLYACGSGHKLRKINKQDLSIIATASWTYVTPIALICKGDYAYIGGTGSSANANTQAIVKVLKSDLSVVSTSPDVGGQVRDLLIIDSHLYSVDAAGGFKKWTLSDLVAAGTIYQHSALIRTLRYKLGSFWLGDNQGVTLRLSTDGQVLTSVSSEVSDNYILEIDESAQMMYRNSSVDVTVNKYQIIDHLQDNTSAVAIKTANLKALNTLGSWVDAVYSVNGLVLTCVTLANGCLRQFLLSGTASADTSLLFHTFDAGKKLLPYRSYILNGVKTTDATSLAYVKLTLAANADGSGDTQEIIKVGGAFNFNTMTNLYYKIEIIVKQGTSLATVLYNNLPSIQPAMLEYAKGAGPYLLSDLSEVALTSVTVAHRCYLIDGRVFITPAASSAAYTIEVRDYQLNTLVTTINTGATQASPAITYDATYIYIGCIKGTPKSIYIQRYNRCTLAFVDEYLLYQNDTPFFTRMIHRDGYLYCQCIASSGVLQHSIKKWSTASQSTVATVYFDTPNDLSLSDYGVVVGGRNVGQDALNLHKPAILSYTDLSLSKLFPNTTLSQQANWRSSVVNGNKLYICNDAGVIVKYDIDTLLIERELVIPEGGIVRSLNKVAGVGLLVTNSFGQLHLYDFDLNYIKLFSMLPTTTSGTHSCLLDENNTVWYHSYQQAKLHKKQFLNCASVI